jgi:GT2 family glycosyltransferase
MNEIVLGHTPHFDFNEYQIVIATPHSKEYFWNKSPASFFLQKSGLSKIASIIYENKKGLPWNYNAFINENNKHKKIIFIHDDVLIEDIFFEEKIALAFEKYDIVGLAGAKICDLNSPMPAWHLMSPREQMVGEVAHSKDKHYWTTVFGPTDSRTLVLDGLFIAVNVAKLLETDTKFDEDFDFHHYDISFCLRANKNRLKMGVYPIKVVHFGMGDSMMSEAWKQSAEKFKQKYK